MQQDALQGLVASAGGAANTLAKNLTADEAKPLAKDEWQATTILSRVGLERAAARHGAAHNTIGGPAGVLPPPPASGGGVAITHGRHTEGVWGGT